MDTRDGDQYDASGNQTGVAAGSDSTSAAIQASAYTFDAENRMVTANVGNTGVASYVYDGDGRRVLKTVGATVTRYVYDAGGQLAVEYSNTSTAAAPRTDYFFTDHLGSTRLIQGTNGQTHCYDYLPFGEYLYQGTGGRPACFPAGPAQPMPSGADGESVKFTAKERDAETGLDYFGARYLSGAQGRFTSADPYVFQFAAASHTSDEDRQKELQETYFSNPQSWNKYAYALNNPLKFIDPNGTCSKPSNQKEGETGVCIEAFIAQDGFGTLWLGRGDQRGFSGTDSSLTARSRIKLTLDKNGKVTSREVESARSGIGVKGLGLRGDTEGNAASQPQGNGSTSLHVDLRGRNGEAFMAPIAPSGVLEGHFNFNVSASGRVDLVNAGSSVTGFPSWGI